MVRQRSPTAQDDNDWSRELQHWGIDDPDQTADEQIPLMQCNQAVVAWWLSVPAFLRWNNHICLGMDVLSVQADAEFSGREVNPDNYQKLKLIARTLTEELNSHE